MSLFNNTELVDLKTYWKRFFYLITGGNETDKEEYSVEALYKIQATIYGDRVPSEDHFDAFTSVFEDTIRELDWEENDQKLILENI